MGRGNSGGKPWGNIFEIINLLIPDNYRVVKIGVWFSIMIMNFLIL
jgi:hypothetical protein